MRTSQLAEREIPTLVAVTKVTKLKPMHRKTRVQVLREPFGAPADRVLATSDAWGLAS